MDATRLDLRCDLDSIVSTDSQRFLQRFRHQLPAGLCAVAGKKLPFEVHILVIRTETFFLLLLQQKILKFVEVVNGTYLP